jgi:hypothetical protein
VKKRWMNEFANKQKPALLEGEIHVFAQPCMTGCCADNFGCCVHDAHFVKNASAEGKALKQTFVFSGVAHKATVYVYEGVITEGQAITIARACARYWR